MLRREAGEGRGAVDAVAERLDERDVELAGGDVRGERLAQLRGAEDAADRTRGEVLALLVGAHAAQRRLDAVRELAAGADGDVLRDRVALRREASDVGCEGRD